MLWVFQWEGKRWVWWNHIKRQFCAQNTAWKWGSAGRASEWSSVEVLPYVQVEQKGNLGSYCVGGRLRIEVQWAWGLRKGMWQERWKCHHRRSRPSELSLARGSVTATASGPALGNLTVSGPAARALTSLHNSITELFK